MATPFFRAFDLDDYLEKAKDRSNSGSTAEKSVMVN